MMCFCAALHRVNVREAQRPVSAVPKHSGSSDSPKTQKQNGVVEFGDVGGSHGLQKAALYVLGEKTQMKVCQMVVVCGIYG